MLENVYEGLNARSTVYFCEMYPTCVSSELCEFIPVVDAFPRLLKRESGLSTFLIWLEREEPKLPLVNWESPFTRIHVYTLIFYIPNHPVSTFPMDWKYPFNRIHTLWWFLPHPAFFTSPLIETFSRLMKQENETGDWVDLTDCLAMSFVCWHSSRWWPNANKLSWVGRSTSWMRVWYILNFISVCVWVCDIVFVNQLN